MSISAKSSKEHSGISSKCVQEVDFQVMSFIWPATSFSPRNVKQVSNVQVSQRQAFRLSHDALYNLHEIAYDTCGFVRKIETYPDLVVMCALKSLTEELNAYSS